MIRLAFLSCIVLLAYACGAPVNHTAGSAHRVLPVSDSMLYTGWYYVIDAGPCKRQLDRTDEYYVLDPRPIVTARQIAQMEIYEINGGGAGLSMQLDEAGAQAWALATEQAQGKKLAFVLHNKLLYTPTVQSSIPGGMTALNRGIYSKAELEKFKAVIQSEHER